ncbi:RHS repeat-associated core domain-containing protein [Flavobacterium alkalisoli]|uniref:RHS repeat-associated core domain-containing protein n=1 Tax=Flavobacterium alkalisoli TaxID=2602769 RepID=UPI001F0E5C3B|nr:RHS repeat-associated core domain-containing protein [Flavobacterium alkalisoli]
MVEEHTNSNNSPFKFNGKEFDEETGNYYYPARYYDPKWSIFTSVDPLAESQPGKSSYHYCSNNPISRIDSSGMLDGDIFNLRGEKIGSDGIDDKKVYLMYTFSSNSYSKDFSEMLIDGTGSPEV